MNEITRPLVTSALLSILLHGVVVALLLVYGPAKITATTDREIEIDLISSIDVASHKETTVAKKSEVLVKKTEVVVDGDIQTKSLSSQKKLAVVKSRVRSKAAILITDDVDDKSKEDSSAEPLMVSEAAFNKKVNQVRDIDESPASQSTNTMQQQESIIALLHASISGKKKYPYIAIRQRREGVARVGFVLHPDGTIEDAHLVSSSSAGTLDRAALSAVKRIEPFIPAKHYLEQAEAFKIDIVFKLL